MSSTTWRMRGLFPIEDTLDRRLPSARCKRPRTEDQRVSSPLMQLTAPGALPSLLYQCVPA